MKGILSLAVCFLSVVVLYATEPAEGLIQFETDFTMASKKAGDSNKFQVVVFNAEWAKSCIWMDENTFSDQSLINFINKNTICTKIDIDSEIGFKLLNIYNVQYLPTILVLDSKGKEIARSQELLDGTSMLSFISTVIPTYNPKTPKMEQPLKPAPKTDSITETESVKIPSTPKPVESNPASLPVAKNTLYKVELNKIEAKGYGVQVGVFTNHEKAMAEAERLKKLVSASELLIHTQELNGITKYKLIFGAFKTATFANEFRAGLKAKQIDGLLKDLSAL